MFTDVSWRIRVWPMLVAAAFVALGFKVIDIYTSVSLLSAPAIAAEEEDNASDDEKADNEGSSESDDASASTSSPANDTLIFGAPTPEQLEILSQLKARREALVARESDLDLREQLLAGTEKRIDDKISQLQDLEASVKGLVQTFEQRETEEFQRIIKVYDTMKPAEAAKVFPSLDMRTQLDIATRMKPAKVAAMLGKMDTLAATELTAELAKQAQAPTLDDIGGR